MGRREQIDQYIEANRQQMLEDLARIVNMEGHYTEKENVLKVQAWVREKFEAEGFQCDVHEVASDRAGILTGILGEGRPGKPILLSGHMDTVFHPGAFGGEEPFRQDGDTVYGPGVQDMKAGIVMSLYIVRALNHIGWKEHPIKIMFVGEEESDHIGNYADEYITENSRDVLCAFNMEGGNTDNELCVGRKSQLTFYMTVHGIGGHAGGEFLIGKNAINETVHKLEKMISLTDLEKGTTVTPTIIKGGIHVCGIPETCESVIDVRIDSETEEKRIRQEMQKIMEHSFIEGTHTEYHVDRARFKPYVENEKIGALHKIVCDAAEDMGYPAFGKVHAGGAADSGNIAYADVPVLCACGIVGGFAHSIREFAMLPSLYDRTKILTYAITRLPEEV